MPNVSTREEGAGALCPTFAQVVDGFAVEGRRLPLAELSGDQVFKTGERARGRWRVRFLSASAEWRLPPPQTLLLGIYDRPPIPVAMFPALSGHRCGADSMSTHPPTVDGPRFRG